MKRVRGGEQVRKPDTVLVLSNRPFQRSVLLVAGTRGIVVVTHICDVKKPVGLKWPFILPKQISVSPAVLHQTDIWAFGEPRLYFLALTADMATLREEVFPRINSPIHEDRYLLSLLSFPC